MKEMKGYNFYAGDVIKDYSRICAILMIREPTPIENSQGLAILRDCLEKLGRPVEVPRQHVQYIDEGPAMVSLDATIELPASGLKPPKGRPALICPECLFEDRRVSHLLLDLDSYRARCPHLTQRIKSHFQGTPSEIRARAIKVVGHAKKVRAYNLVAEAISQLRSTRVVEFPSDWYQETDQQ